MRVRRSVLASFAAASLSAAAAAQTVRGVVADAGGHPVAGVVVFLVDSGSQVAARALSDGRGSYALVATHAGTYRVRTQRIGFRPTITQAFPLLRGGEVTRDIGLDGVPIGLDTMKVVDRDVCRAFSDSAAATFAVWEQIRAALIATQLTSGSRTIAATTVSYDRSLDPGPGRSTGKVLRERSNTSTDYVTRVWRTQPPDTLHRAGYVVAQRDNTIEYYAPGLDMLLSDIFVGDHCFRMTTDRKEPGLLGIRFEPTPERKRGVAEVHGTIWLDRASSELRRMEFRYVNVPPEVEGQAGGQVDFVRMRDGTWAVASWNIRMPVVAQVVIPGHGAEPRVQELQEAGGDLVLARRGSDTLWTRATSTVATAAVLDVGAAPGAPRTYVLTGTVVADSLHVPIAAADVAFPDLARSALTDAHGAFRLTGISAGSHRLHVRAIGYGATDVDVVFAERDSVELEVVLRRAVALNPVNVAAARPLLPSFEENRKLGLGRFLTRADLASQENNALDMILEQLRGARIIRGPTGRAWITSNRGLGGHPIAPDIPDSIQGAPASPCYTQVYLNDAVVFAGRSSVDRSPRHGSQVRWEPLFDITTFSPSQLEAVEFYAGPSETPLKYQKYDPHCGVLVLWTRRSP